MHMLQLVTILDIVSFLHRYIVFCWVTKLQKVTKLAIFCEFYVTKGYNFLLQLGASIEADNLIINENVQ